MKPTRVLFKRKPGRVVVSIEGSPFWTAERSVERALGRLLLDFGPRLGIEVVDEDEEPKPWVRVIRTPKEAQP